MRKRYARPIVLVTLVAYLLATTGTIGTHQHHHGLVDEAPVATVDCSEHFQGHQQGSHCHHHEPIDATTSDGCDDAQQDHHCPGRPSHGPLDDDDCAVCKMLSAKLLAPAPVTLVMQIGQVAELRLQAVSAPAAPFDGLPLSRGPPACG